MLFLFVVSSLTISQNIYKTSDVKLKAPFKISWEYKITDIIVNQHITGDICYVNTINGISAISLTDGKSIWNYSYHAFPLLNSVATFSDKYAAFTTYNYNDSTEIGISKLTLVDLSQGKEVWSIESKERFYKPTPFITDNYVFCLSGPPNEWRVKEKYFKIELDEAELIAHSLLDGKEVWKTSVKDEESELINADNKYVFIKHDFDESKGGIPKNKLSAFSSTNGEKLWTYDPSGMITKSSVDKLLIDGDKLYVAPLPGKSGVVALINLLDGEEKWSLRTTAADNIYLQSANLTYYGSSTWMCIDVQKGERITGKSFSSPSIFGAILGQAFGNTVFGKIAATFTGYSNLFSKLFGSDDSAPLIIPTRAMYSGLLNSSAVNEKGLFAIYFEDGKPIFVKVDNPPKEDVQTEYKFADTTSNAFIANGTSETSAFLTVRGKIYSVNYSTRQIEWEKDLTNDRTIASLGIIIKGNKLICFTNNSIRCLENSK
jgi:outer membrane protein assembly factor BamB